MVCVSVCSAGHTGELRKTVDFEAGGGQIIGNESLPKIITTIEFLNSNQHFGNISNHNSFRVLLDKIASVYFI